MIRFRWLTSNVVNFELPSADKKVITRDSDSQFSSPINKHSLHASISSAIPICLFARIEHFVFVAVRVEINIISWHRDCLVLTQSHESVLLRFKGLLHRKWLCEARTKFKSRRCVWDSVWEIMRVISEVPFGKREKNMLLPKTENTKIIWCESTAEPTPTMLLMVRPRICCCSTSIFRMCPHGAYAGPLRLVSYRNHVAAFIIHRQFVRKPAKATAFGIWRMQNASQGWQAPTIRSYCAVIGNTVISRANY